MLELTILTMKTAKILRVLAVIWLVLFAIVFAFGMITIAVTDGINVALWIMSPFNVAGFIVNIISLSPAILLYWLAGKFEGKKESPDK